METQEISEGNKLIAEFMGLLNIRDARPELRYNYDIWQLGVFIEGMGHKRSPIDPSYAMVDKLLYNDSWDWLIPVIDKISDCPPNSKEHYYWNEVDLDIRIFRASKDETYNSILEYIKWYNANKIN